jgi:hypothetical protein
VNRERFDNRQPFGETAHALVPWFSSRFGVWLNAVGRSLHGATLESSLDGSNMFEYKTYVRYSNIIVLPLST